VEKVTLGVDVHASAAPLIKRRVVHSILRPDERHGDQSPTFKWLAGAAGRANFNPSVSNETAKVKDRRRSAAGRELMTTLRLIFPGNNAWVKITEAIANIAFVTMSISEHYSTISTSKSLLES
jgi:hypothetical protein